MKETIPRQRIVALQTESDMYHKFNAKEILEMAEQIERNGYKFYMKAAADVQGDDNIKNFLKELAEMEVSHEKMFQEMKDQLSSKEKEDVVFDPNEETAMYIQALADARVFYEKDIDTTSVIEVLKEAIVAEKDSIVFYLGMKDMVPSDKGKAKIDLIIREEMSHIQIISNQLKKYAA
jgi:rubrerythrin